MEENAQTKKSAKLDEIISVVDESHLASIQGVVSGVMEIINNPRSNAKDLKDLIEVDPPLTAKVLRIANSAYFASPRKISEIDQAVIWVGFDTLKEIVLSQQVCEFFKQGDDEMGATREMMWKHSLAVALIAKMIFRREFGERGENAYAAGLMHDIGIMIEDQFYHDDFEKMIQNAKDQKRTYPITEQELFSCNHAEIGQAVTNHWELPEDLIFSIGSHHTPQTAMSDFDKLTKTLYVADHLAIGHGMHFSHAAFTEERVFFSCMDDLGLQSYAVKSIVQEMLEELKKMEDKGFLQA